MDNSRETLYQSLDELNKLIKENEKQDGTFAFDIVKAQVVLDFAKTEIQKSIQKNQ